ncbi:type II CRISPR RNA-guided endonuclease Cas9 [Limosilactobacillus mucosae]|uniref:CRISPR-associated endonuclease Cas9 n=1 Tax=Limosilactobacillus mucosae TaxID=97478 RepID=A0A508YX46_LIMMU|nr:type II CRISPR RNA-guided endonuclease Cas9 [Limosilactobacillus mucosae]VTZ91849.1 CRISPR-associated endonuclease Cas9 [Limosilactobacillus mucosae]
MSSSKQGLRRYHLGLDIGTNSIGWTAIDDHFSLLRVKGKNAIGVRTFKEGETAADRRGFRTARRRLSRRRWRLQFLDDFFAPYLAEVDPNFLARLKQSDISAKDPAKNQEFMGKLLFPDQEATVNGNGYPTLIQMRKEMSAEKAADFPVFNIYQLRYALMNEKRKFDLREIYLAVHHIVKYRGNFLNNTSVDKFKANQIDFNKSFETLNDLFRQVQPTTSFQIDLTKVDELGKLLLDTKQKKADRQKAAAKLLPLIEDGTDKEIVKAHQQTAREISKLILGYKAKVGLILQNNLDQTLDMSTENSDDQLMQIAEELDDYQKELINQLSLLYSQIMLNEIVPNGETVSASMLNRYYKHRRQLKELKTYGAAQDKKTREQLDHLYAEYIGQVPKDSKFDFTKDLKKLMDKSDLGQKIKGEIEAGDYLPKQRTSANGVIPHQMHQQELDQIIENQKEYYPWLAEPNPVEKNIKNKNAKYYLDQLVSFRVPYYVGPMITLADQQKTSKASFAWAVRKEAGKITPWNFYDKIDREKSANNFIKRMTHKDTYLLSEDVLPASSLLYQKYTVLDELNNIRVNGRKLQPALKQAIYTDLFKKRKTVNLKALTNFLTVHEPTLTKPKIKGLSNGRSFNSSLGTYIDMSKILGNRVDDLNYRDDIEKIIEWSTVFEDSEIYGDKLQEIQWLTNKQREKLVRKRYQGWGRLSKKLLTGITDENGQRIIDLMWDTNKNFMQIVHQPVFEEQITELNQQLLQDADKAPLEVVDDILADAYTSPQNKKAIRQVVKVVADVVKAVGNAPASISIEFARNEDRNKELKNSRRRSIEKLYHETAEKLVKQTNLLEELGNVKDLNDRYYLYFTQAGRDMYDGTPINIDEISTHYEIDHILPQSFLKDNSLDNRVLVKKSENAAKSDRVPAKIYGAKMRDFWKQLKESQLISNRKYLNLTTDPEQVDKYQMQGFVHRQLVETRQIIKLAANIFGSLYPDSAVIETRAELTKQLREKFSLYKVRDVNDYHHAVDAYLTAFAGHYLYQRYPKLRPMFVYGDYAKIYADDLKRLRSVNLFHDLEKDQYNSGTAVNPETKEKIVDVDWLSDYVSKIQHFKYMLISKAVYVKHGKLYDATIAPASKVATKSNPIKIKNSKPVDIYGAYTHEVAAYMAIVRVNGKKPKYKVVSVPVRMLQRLKMAEQKGHDQYMQTLHDVLSRNFTSFKKNRKTGLKEAVVKDFDVLVPCVRYNQLVIDGDVKFTLGSHEYQHNAKQLVLSDHSLETLANNFEYVRKHPNEADERMTMLYDDILAQVNHYFTLYDKNKFREKLNAGRDKYLKLPTFSLNKKDASKAETIINMLRGLHANATAPEMKYILNTSTGFGAFQTKSGIQLSENAKLVYQSPTGLFSREVLLKDL